MNQGQAYIKKIKDNNWDWHLNDCLSTIDKNHQTEFITTQLVPAINSYIADGCLQVSDPHQGINPQACQQIEIISNEINQAIPNVKLTPITKYVRLRIIYLRKQLRHWEYEYYGLQKPTVSDTFYDLKLRELKDLETYFPKYDSQSSPTKNVGGTVDNRFAKVTHSSPMLSLDNAFSLSELEDFDRYIKKALKTNQDLEYNVEPKFDGLSMALIYTNGKLTLGLTRGNGKVGEDVTKNIAVIEDIPKTINIASPKFEVRGEVYLNYQQFEKINDEIVDEKKKFANPRNAAAGALHRLDPELVKQYKLKFVAYYIPNEHNLKELGIKNQSEVLGHLKQLGFTTASESWKCSSVQKAYEKIQYLESHQDDFDYPIDGGVLKLNQIDLYSQIGSTSKFPHWAIAYKFIPKEAITKVLDIYPTVGRTGKITYVAKLAPVHLSGSVISAATLNNAEYIKTKDVRIGDYVKIIKAAEIIPYIKEPVLEKRTSECQPYQPITKCPICGSQLERRPDEVDQFCVNTSCPARILQSIIHFCSKSAMDIYGLSSGLLGKFFDYGYIKSIPDIYRLNNHREKIIHEVMNDTYKVFNKIIGGIEKSKHNSLERLLVGLGIRDIGTVSSLALARHYQSLDNLSQASIEELKQLRDVGEIVANSIYDWFHNQSNIDLIQQLKELGINMQYLSAQVSQKNKQSAYYQKSICITGSFDIPREQIKQKLIDKYDIKFTNSLTKSTDYLIAGDNAGSKIDKAKEWKIKIITDKIWED